MFAQFFRSPLSFGNDYTFSAEQIYYRWFSLVPSRDLGKLPHMRFFHTLLLLLNYVYVHCQTSHCVRTKEAKAIMGWAKGRSKNGGWNQKSRRGAMWRLTPQIVSGAAVWIPQPISPYSLRFPSAQPFTREARSGRHPVPPCWKTWQLTNVLWLPSSPNPQATVQPQATPGSWEGRKLV